MVECYPEKRNVDSRQIKFWNFFVMVWNSFTMMVFKILISNLSKWITTTHEKFLKIQSMIRI